MPEVRPWTYPYAQIAEHYRGEIRDGRLKPGDRLPTVAKIAKDWGVAIVTVQRALGLLREEGWINIFHGRGSYVADEPPRETPP